MERCCLALFVFLATVVHASGLHWESTSVSALSLGAEDVEALRNGVFTETNVDWVKKVSEGTDGLECILECNMHPAESSCKGFAETKCVGIFEGDNATVYVKHDYVCAGEFESGYKDSKKSFTVNVACQGARVGKTLIAISPLDGDADDEEGHPEFSAVIEYGYECAMKHTWSMKSSKDESGMETETTTCSGAESFQMIFFGHEDEEVWTADDIDALSKENPLPTSADATNAIIADVIESVKDEVPFMSSEEAATVSDLQNPDKSATCNDEEASFIGVCQGVFAFSVTGDKFEMDGTCEGLHFGGFHQSICSGKAATVTEREEPKRTELTASSCVGRESFKTIIGHKHGHEDHDHGPGHGFSVCCLGESESEAKRVPKSEPSASSTSGLPRKTFVA